MRYNTAIAEKHVDYKFDVDPISHSLLVYHFGMHVNYNDYRIIATLVKTLKMINQHIHCKDVEIALNNLVKVMERVYQGEVLRLDVIQDIKPRSITKIQ